MSGIDLKSYLVKETPAEEDKSKDINSYLVKEPKPEPVAEAPSLLGGIGRSVLSGLVSSLGSVTSGVGYVGKKAAQVVPDEKDIARRLFGNGSPILERDTRSPGETLSDYLLSEGQKTGEMGARISKNVPQNLVNRTAQGLGSMVPYAVAGYLTGGAANAAAMPAAGALLSPSAAVSGAASSSVAPAAIAEIVRSQMETQANAAQTYQALKNKGYDDATALRAAGRQELPDSVVNLLLEPFGALSDKGRLMRMAGEAVQEGVIQEPGQNITQAAALRSAEGSLWDFGKALWEETKNYPQQFREVGLPAMIAGALVGGMSPGIGAQAQEVRQDVKQEAKRGTPKVVLVPQVGAAYIDSDGEYYTVTGEGENGFTLESPRGKTKEVSRASFDNEGLRAVEVPADVDELSSTSRAGFEPAMPQGEMTSARKVSEVGKIIEDILGIPVRTRQIRSRKTLGYINHTNQVIRSKSKNDIATLLHEFGHAIDRKFGLSENAKQVYQEFNNFGKLMGYKKHLWQREGLAQFFQWRGIDPEQAYRMFPEYSKVFDEFLKQNPDAEKMIKPVFEAAYEYYHATPEARLDAIIADRQNAGKPSVKEFLAGKMKSARRSLIDRQAIFGEINQTVANAFNVGKRMLPDSVNLEAAVRTMPGVKAVIKQKVSNFQKHYAGFTPDEKQALTRYMIAGDALDYYANGMNPGTGLTQEELTAIRERTPEKVRQAAEAMRAEYDQMMEDTLVRSGMITKEMLDEWKKKYPNYSPMIAVDDDGSPRLMSPREKGIVSLEQPGSTQARQSVKYDRDIQMRMDPVAAMLNNYRIFHDLAARNDVGKTLVNISKIPGMAKIVEKVPNMGNNVFWVWEGGKKRYYATDPEIYAALRTMGEAGIPDNAFYRFAHNVSEIFKAGTTRYNPWFIPKNFIRDSFTMSLQSRGKAKSLRNMPFVNTFDGIMQMLGADKTMLNDAIEDGVFYSSIVELNQDNVPKLINDNLRGGRLKETLRKLRNVADRIGEWNEVVELAPKLREYILLRNQGIPRKQAAMEAREVNVDFQRAGTVGRVLNQYIPFLNAQIQGVDKVVRTFREHPKESMLKAGIYLTLPSVLEWILYHDDEDYKALDKGIKDTHWIFRLPGAAPDDFVRVPMPFEAGVLFGGAAKRAMDKMVEKDPAAWMDYFTSAKEAIVPEMQIALLRPWVEVWANKDSFRDRPIVPLKEQNLPNRLQYGSSTSYPAKLAGQVLDVSPRKVDHLIRGYGGTMASQASHLFDALDKGKAPAPSRNWHESTLFRPYTISSDTSNLYIKRFYDVADKLEKELTGAKAEHTVYKDANLARAMSGPRQYLSRIWKRIGEVRDSQTMSPDDKAKEIDRLNKMAIQIAKSALERYDKRKK